MTALSRTQRNSLQNSTFLSGVLAILAAAQPAQAQPTGGNVVGGAANIASSGKHTEITQTTNRALIEWQQFNVGASESVNFAQPSKSAIALNRVTGSQAPSVIAGKLSANGNVIISNSQGVMFTGGADVNVGGLVATTADIDNKAFMNGDLNFNKKGSANASVSNAGSIKVADGGMALLVGPNVTNDGMIQASVGKVQLASGDTFAVDMYGDGLLSLQASDELTKQLVSNSGKIEANGGQVLLTAAAAESTVSSLINMDGLIQANNVGNKNGKVVLYAEGSNAVKDNVAANKGKKTGTSTVEVSGTIEAKGGAKGGTVKVLGDTVALLGATIDASGEAEGGKVLIGGNYKGEGKTPTANLTIVDDNSTILANATNEGNGGKVIVWADGSTSFTGSIEAKNAGAGKGGFVETSGKDYLEAFGSVDAGKGGTWLLDPRNVTVSNAATSGGTYSGGVFTPTSDSAKIKISAFEATLNAGTNVTITTGTTGSQEGNITISGAISKTDGGDATLSFIAANNILLSSSITSSNNKLNVVFDAANDAIFNSGASVTTNGGNITVHAGNAFTNNVGASVFTTGAGRWLIYSVQPSNNTLGGLSSDFYRYSCTYGGSCPTFPGSGNGLLYSITPVLTLTVNPEPKTIYYGDAIPADFTYTLSGYEPGDAATDVVTGEAGFSTNYTQGNNVGSYNITATAGTLLSSLGYSFTGSTLTNGLTVAKALLEIIANNQTQTYGAGNNLTQGYAANGLVLGETIGSVTLNTNATSSGSGNWNATNGTPWTITASNATGGTFDINNYDVTYTAGSLTIDPKALNVTFTANDKEYDANTNAAFSGVSDDHIVGDVVNVQYGSASFNNKNVGADKVVTLSGLGKTGAAAGNYTLAATATALADITKRDLNITANNQTQTYGAGNSLTQGFGSSGLQGGETIGSVSLATNAQNSTSGNWKATNGTPWAITASNATGGTFDANNYEITYTGGSLTINRKDLEIAATGVDKSYDGTTDATVTLSDDRIVGDLFDSSYTDANFTNYHKGNNRQILVDGIAISGTDAANYTITSAINNLHTTANITAATLTVTANSKTMTYGSGNTLAGYSLSGLIVGETVGSVDLSTDAQSSTSGNWKATNGTPWTITASNATGGTFDPADYIINYVAGSLTINPLALIVNAMADDKVYDALTTANVTGISGDDRISGDVFDVTYTGGNFDNKNVGTDKVVTLTGVNLSGTDAGNYTVSSATGLADITKRGLTVTANNQTKTYGGSNNLNAGFSSSGLQGGETIGSVSLSTDATLSTSGRWNATNGTPWNIFASNASGGTFNIGNYEVTYVEGSLTVNRRNLTISANASNKTYDGTRDASVSLSNNRLSGDVVNNSYTTALFEDKNAGTGKLVTVSGLSISGTDSNNYNLTNSEAFDTARIRKRDLTITATGVDKTYDATFDAEVTLTDNRVSGDIFTDSYGSAFFLNRNAGDGRTIVVTGLSISGLDAGNYNIANFLGGALTSANIFRAALSITANDQSQTYGDGNSLTEGYTAVGLQGGESPWSVTLNTDATSSTSGNWNATNGSPFSITASNAVNNIFNGFRTSNYDITYVDGALTIAQKGLDVSVTASDKVYDATILATVTGVFDDRISGDVFDVDYTAANFDDKNVGIDKTVTVSGLSLSGTDAANYAVLSPSAGTTADISTATLSINADEQTKVYGSADPFLSFTFAGFAGADDSSLFTGGLVRDAGEHVADGPFAINLGSLSAGGNYTIDYVGNSLIITPATLGIFADNQIIRLGDSIPLLTYLVQGLTNGDGLEILSGDLTTVPRETLPGIYGILQGTLGANSDYVIDYNQGFLTIVSPFEDINSASQQNSQFDSSQFTVRGAGRTLLSISNGGGGTAGGNFGNLAPAAGGENPGGLEPSAGGSTALIECDENNPCDNVY